MSAWFCRSGFGNCRYRADSAAGSAYPGRLTQQSLILLHVVDEFPLVVLLALVVDLDTRGLVLAGEACDPTADLQARSRPEPPCSSDRGVVRILLIMSSPWLARPASRVRGGCPDAAVHTGCWNGIRHA